MIKEINSVGRKCCKQNRGWPLGPRLPVIAMTVLSALAAAGCEQKGQAHTATVAADSASSIPDGIAQLSWAVGGATEMMDVVLEGPPSAGAFGSRGSLAIIDRSARQALLFDETGRLLGRIGRQGNGPGEFSEPRRIGFLGDSAVFVSDVSNGRITVFDRDGKVLRTHSRPWQQVPRSLWSAGGDILLLSGTIVARPRGVPESVLDGTYSPLPVAMWTAAGEFSVLRWIERLGPSFRRTQTTLGYDRVTEQPLNAAPIIGASSSGAWFFAVDRRPAESSLGTIRIYRYGPGGEGLDEIAISYKAAPIDGEIRSWIEKMAEASANVEFLDAGKVPLEEVLKATWLPRMQPPIREALADGAGFWLRRERSQPGVWERYDLTGRIVGRVVLPANLSGLAGDAERLLGFRNDSLSVPVLEYYHIAFPRTANAD